jgi:hypothetical protein
MEKHHYIKFKNIYGSWSQMKRRCYDPRVADYANYGGRGITYDSRWEDFENFFVDMKDGWRKGLTLDRIDNNGNYNKENCRWATRKTQATNRRSTRLFVFHGIAKTLTDWATELNIKRSTLAQRFYVYKWPVKKCLGG